MRIQFGDYIKGELPGLRFSLLKLCISIVALFTSICLRSASGLFITLAITAASFFIDLWDIADSCNGEQRKIALLQRVLYVLSSVCLSIALILFFYAFDIKEQDDPTSLSFTNSDLFLKKENTIEGEEKSQNDEGVLDEERLYSDGAQFPARTSDADQISVKHPFIWSINLVFNLFSIIVMVVSIVLGSLIIALPSLIRHWELSYVEFNKVVRKKAMNLRRTRRW